jgi:ATP-dependent RNA helicase DHX8/PRP22
MKEPETDYLDDSLITVMQIHLTESPGDVLLSLTGHEDIDTSREILYKYVGLTVPKLVVLPIHSDCDKE